MSAAQAQLGSFLDAWTQVAIVEIIDAKGSTPREAATWMLVSPQAIYGTIGGGQLEFMAIDRARQVLASGEAVARMDIPLGPEIGQCCGGRVVLVIAVMDKPMRAAIEERVRAEQALQSHVYVFGAGHVGHALAAALATLPVTVTVAETRPDELAGLAAGVTPLAVAVPEDVVRQAPPGSAFMVLTHDHALDFLIVAEALRRGDAAYVGMIGSKTKRATFRNWFLKEASGDEATLERLVCPIGGSDVRDKRPAVIAALAVAEVIRSLAASG